MLDDAVKEIQRADELWKDSDLKALRSQMDIDFGYWGPYEFKMDKKEGGWTSVTSPSGRTTGNKIKALLQESELNLYINVLEEERGKNKRIAATERLALGFINQADRMNSRRPSGVTLQDAFSFYAAIHAGTACSVLITEKDGKPVNHTTYYDPYGCVYIEDEEGIIWFCYREDVKKIYLEKRYAKQIKDGLVLESGDTGLVTVYTFWDGDEWKIAINKEYVDGDKHGLGYTPVFYNPVGGIPPILSVETNITRYKHQSVFMNNRELIPIESELMSIEMTNAKQSARVRGIAEYDSTLSDGQIPEDAKKLVRMAEAEGQKDNVALFDTAKGMKWMGYVKAPDNAAAERFHQLIRAYSTMASIDPVTFGAFNGSGSGALANILRDAALEFIHPFSKNIADTFTWIAEEGIKQFKAGNYPEAEVSGRDIRRQPFMETISREEVEEHNFTCELVADRLRDRAVQLGMAIDEVRNGLSDKKSAVAKYNLSSDPDKTLEMIEQEKHAEMAALDPVHHNMGMAEWHKNQMTGDKEKDAVHQQMVEYHTVLAQGAAQIAVQSLALQVQQLLSPPPPSGNGGSSQPGVTAEAGRQAAAPMTEMNNSIEAEMRQ